MVFDFRFCSPFPVCEGPRSGAGFAMKVAESGATGNVTGPHLHLELTLDGVYYNPEFYLS